MRRALLIGVSVYDRTESELAQLRTPAADAQCLADALSSDSIGRYDTAVLCDPVCDDVRRKVESFLVSAAPEDELLFYYSGHGRLSPNGGLLLCARDTEAPSVTSSTLKATDIAEWTQLCAAHTLVMIFDCCFSGQVFGDGVKSPLADEPVKAAIGAALMPGRGKYVITSSTRFQTSLELPGDPHSLFTKWLLHGILTGEADSNRDGKISIDELYSFVHAQVIGERVGQTPEYMARAEAPGEVVIAFAPSNVGRSSPPSQPLTALERLLSRQWCEGRLVPFLGHSLYGDSPLGQNALATSLQIDGVRAISSPIATVAEHFFLERNREDLLEHLSTELEIGEASENKTVGRRLLQQIAANERLGLVVVATYDHLLEIELEAVGRPYVTLTHILESGPNWHQSVGKVAVVRAGRPAECELYCADKAVLPANHLVVYRPLGSPRLNGLISRATGRPVNTVVITETDHLVFGRLYPEEASFPTVLSSRLLGKRLMFLGYTLDVWHYRFVIRMLAKQSANNPEPWAVRRSMDTIEQKCWDRLGAKVLDTDLTAMLERVLAAGGASWPGAASARAEVAGHGR